MDIRNNRHDWVIVYTKWCQMDLESLFFFTGTSQAVIIPPILVNVPCSCNETQHYYMFLSFVLQEMECTWCHPIFRCQVSFHKRFGRQRHAFSKGASALERELNVKWINDRCTKSLSTLHQMSKSKVIYIWKKNIFCNYDMD